MPGYLWANGTPLDVQLVVFDKDDTLLDYRASWLPALRECAEAVAIAAGEPALQPALLKAGGWQDTEQGPAVAAESIMYSGTNLELAQHWIDTQPMVAAHWADAAALHAEMQAVFLKATVRDATPFGTVQRALEDLRAAGVKLAVVTNDDELLARAQLQKLGWEHHFELVVGSDSGHGRKPGPGGIRAAMASAGVTEEQTIMVGNAATDMAAARVAACLFSVAIYPDGPLIPENLAIAAVRLPSVQPLPQVLADGGHTALRKQLARAQGVRDAADDLPDGGVARPQIDPDQLLDAAHALELEPSLDPELLAIVDAIKGPPGPYAGAYPWYGPEK